MRGFLGVSTTLILSAGLMLSAMHATSRAAEAPAPMQLAQADTDGNARRCLKCHDQPPATLVLHTAHAQMADPRTPFANDQCQECHGASERHMEKPEDGQKRKSPDVVFGRKSPTPAEVQNKVCLACHEGALRMNWVASDHQAEDVSCGTCHGIHAIRDPVLVKATQPQICFSCHFDKRAQTRKFSRHPVKEGKVVCSDCHNPHGSFARAQLVKNTVNETCYQCHAELRGPFLWEHAPVSDDCTLCHDPHGSSQPRMLKVRTPYLCQQCHSEAQHPSTLYSGTGLPIVNPGSRLLAKGCLNCHPKVHGTNHPSGPRLTR